MKKNLRYFMTLLLMMVASVGWAVDTWVKTDITSLATGDVVAIVDVSSSRAMANDKGTGSAPTATSVTLSEDKTNITSVVPNSLQWVLTVDDNGYSFGVGTTFLYCNSSNNGVRVGTNNNKVFAWQKDANSSFNNKDNFLYNIATGRYLGVYSDSDWRCYTSVNSNIQNTTTAFYKKVEGTETFCAIPTFTPEANTYTTTQTVEIACTTNGATIHYTTDGSEPTAESATYTNAIEVSTSTTIKAIAVKDGLDNSSVATGIFTIFGGVNATDVGSGYYEKVTDVSTLANGDAILIVNEEYAKALSTTQNETYRGEANVTINANTIDAPSAEVQKLVLAGENGAWFLSVGGENSFLYSPESGNNLETTETVSDAARATITFTEGNAYIRFNGTNTANLISYNYNSGNNSRFSCYVAPQSPVQIYKEVVKPNKEEPGLAYETTSYEITYGNEFTTPELTNPNELTVAYASSEEGVATVDASTGVVTIKGVGTTTITASFAGNESFLAGSASYTLTVNANPNAPGGVNNPYTVAQARAAIDANTGITGVYATGIVSQVDSYNSKYYSITYWISADGTTTSDQLEVYSGKGIGGENFNSENDIQVGDVVTVYGNLKKYNTTYEFDMNNQLVSLTRPEKPAVTVSFNEPTTTVNVDETVTNVAIADVEGVTVVYSSSDTSIATVNGEGVVTGVTAGTATITATIEEAANYDVTVATYEIQVIDPSAPVAETYTFNKITSTDDLVAGGEYIIVCEENNVVMAKYGVGTSKVFDQNAIQIENNSIEIEEGTANILTLGGETGAWTFATSLEEGYYLGLSSSSNALNSLTEGNITWSISFDDNGNCVITSAAFDTRAIRYNSGSPRFACYASGQKAIQLYKKVSDTPAKVSIKTAASGYTTLVSGEALDIANLPEGLTAYYVAEGGISTDKDKVTLTQVKAAVPAETPLIFKGAVSTPYEIPIATSGTALSDNQLAGSSTESTTFQNDGDAYILSGGEFHPTKAGTFPAGKAYLNVSAVNAKALTISFAETNGINNVNVENNTNEKIFNLAGQQMKSAVKGVYIKNGRKYVK